MPDISIRDFKEKIELIKQHDPKFNLDLDFAAEVSVDKSTFSKWKNSSELPSHQLKDLAKMTNTEPHWWTCKSFDEFEHLYLDSIARIGEKTDWKSLISSTPISSQAYLRLVRPADNPRWTAESGLPPKPSLGDSASRHAHLASAAPLHQEHIDTFLPEDRFFIEFQAEFGWSYIVFSRFDDDYVCLYPDTRYSQDCVLQVREMPTRVPAEEPLTIPPDEQPGEYHLLVLLTKPNVVPTQLYESLRFRQHVPQLDMTRQDTMLNLLDSLAQHLSPGSRRVEGALSGDWALLRKHYRVVAQHPPGRA